MGVLYFAQAENLDIKIGATLNLKTRLKALSSLHKMKFKLLNTIENGSEYERSLHKYYEQYNLGSEWFDLPESQIEYLKNLTYERLIRDYNKFPSVYDNSDFMNIRIPASLKRELRIYAAENDTTMIEVILESIQEKINFKVEDWNPSNRESQGT